MQLTRPRNLYLGKCEHAGFDLGDLVAGGSGIVRRDLWQAMAPHLGAVIELEFEDLAVFDAVPCTTGCDAGELRARFGTERIDRLVAAGLLIGDHDGHLPLRERSQALERAGWWPVAALAQSLGRWQGVDVALDQQTHGRRTLAAKLASAGPPPPAAAQVRDSATWLGLPAPRRTALDALFASRATCRNFDPAFELPLAELSDLLHRVYGAQAEQVLAPGAVALKKHSPSGGGLHPIEAYLLVQRVEGLAAGLYHYHCTGHALEPMRALSATEAAAAAYELVAGQAWFVDAPVLVLMAARFERCYWKYRNHSKAWKVVQLDAGHLSQTFYLSATERGYGAFVTGAINDDCAERLFELDGIANGAVAVCGVGRRAAELHHIELDPLGKAVRA